MKFLRAVKYLIAAVAIVVVGAAIGAIATMLISALAIIVAGVALVMLVAYGLRDWTEFQRSKTVKPKPPD